MPDWAANEVMITSRIRRLFSQSQATTSDSISALRRCRSTPSPRDCRTTIPRKPQLLRSCQRGPRLPEYTLTHPAIPVFIGLGRQRTFAYKPWNRLKLDATRGTFNATHRIHGHDWNPPLRNEVDTMRCQLNVVAPAPLATT